MCSLNSLTPVMTKQNLAWGRGEGQDKAHLSHETAYLRRWLSSAAVGGFGQRLTSRMRQVGKGAMTATGRRQEWSCTAVQAAWLAKVTEQDIVRRGIFTAVSLYSSLSRLEQERPSPKGV